MIHFHLRRSIRGRRRSPASLAASILVTCALGAGPALAAFDAPMSTKKSTAADGRETICTDYGDHAVIETRDGPAAEAAILVSGDGVRCGAEAAKRGLPLATSDMALEGRVGPVLLFTQMDGHGAVGFVAIAVNDGRVVLKEALVGSPSFRSTQLRRDGSVILTYRRGVNAPCSLQQNAGKCWARMVAEGSVPAGLAKQAPQASACTKAYAAMSAPRDAPSIAEWNQETIIEYEGAVTSRPTSAVACGVQP